MLSLSEDTQQDVIVAFNNTSRYLDYIFYLDNSYFDQMVSYIYLNELQLNKENSWNFSASFFNLHITVKNNTIHIKIYDKRDNFDFDIVNYPNLDGNVSNLILCSLGGAADNGLLIITAIGLWSECTNTCLLYVYEWKRVQQYNMVTNSFSIWA
jgi:hypothetical protein